MDNMINFPVLLLAALVPMLLGVIYYHPALLGKAWMKSAGLSEEQLKDPMARILILTYIFSVLAAFVLQFLVIHQYSIFSVVADEFQSGNMESAGVLWANSAMEAYGHKFRTFGHGAFHGFLTGLFLGLPIIGMNALFERKSMAYIGIHTGFWCICFMLMGGIICQFA